MNEPISHETAQELLPWYVNGTLAETERGLVASHLSSCLVCRAELNKERRLRELVRSSPTVDTSAEAGFDRLAASLDGGGKTRGRRPQAARASRATLSRRALAATLAAAVVGGLLWSVLPERDTSEAPEYFTLTSESQAANLVDVVFVDAVTSAEMRALLEEIGGSVVSGPSGVGRYTIRVDAGALSTVTMPDLLRQLNADRRVAFAATAMQPEPRE